MRGVSRREPSDPGNAEREQRILAFMSEEAYRPLTEEELMRALHVPRGATEAVRQLLLEMEARGAIVRTRGNRLGVPARMNLVVGRFEAHEKGYGFVLSADRDEQDVYIAPDDMDGAVHGDLVIARILGVERGGRRTGRVIRVLERAHPTIVGLLDSQGDYALVRPDDRRLPSVFVPGSALAGAQSGEKVVVRIERWPEGRQGAVGRVLQRLGRAEAPGVDVLSILTAHGLSADFPAEVREEAAAVPQTVRPGERRGRKDLRRQTVVTIDSEDTRDIDDAISLEPGQGGARWRLGVHIADVSHYVREGTALDAEARRRGTSVYLVDRVLPMLPPELSNGIASLNPGEERLTLSVFIDFDSRGERVDHTITPSVIRSSARLTYTQVWTLFQGDEEVRRELGEPVAKMLLEMRQLADQLRARRMERGAIDLDLPEAKALLDQSGRATDIVVAERNEAHRLIEEFMLAANEVVAEEFFWRRVPFLYRVHERPSAERIEQLRAALAPLGIAWRSAAEPHPKELQRVVEQVRGRPGERLIHSLVLRSMARARYSPENLGHYALATRNYCHFTSPIRRYPDLFVHRVIHAALSSEGIPPRQEAEWRRLLPDLAAHCSETEREADEAERESVEAKMMEVMEGRVGELFDGWISGVTSFGIFVQLTNLAEGLVHVSTITDDYYQYDPDALQLVGERTGRIFRLGDPVRVRVAAVHRVERRMDLLLADEAREEAPATARRGRRNRAAGSAPRERGAARVARGDSPEAAKGGGPEAARGGGRPASQRAKTAARRRRKPGKADPNRN
ncbi:MAG: ribonuclease R [Bacillota bacterium]|nr:ribonuclease R [Bacillota bacterium]